MPNLEHDSLEYSSGLVRLKASEAIRDTQDYLFELNVPMGNATLGFRNSLNQDVTVTFSDGFDRSDKIPFNDSITVAAGKQKQVGFATPLWRIELSIKAGVAPTSGEFVVVVIGTRGRA